MGGPDKKPKGGTSKDRFEYANKPQFRPAKSTATKFVVEDERFAGVLTDPRFQITTTARTDKYGRKQKKGKQQTASEQLSAFYTVEKSKADVDEKQLRTNEEGAKEDDNETSDKSEASLDSSQQQQVDDDQKDDNSKHESVDEDDPVSRIAYLTALSRGEVDLTSSSDDDESGGPEDDESKDDDDSSTEDPVLGKVGILDPSYAKRNTDGVADTVEDEIEMTEEPSNFMAILNLDWTHIRAVDIYAILASFVTQPGAIRSVRVYPSDFGIERMKKDQLMGPVGVWKKKKKKSDSNNKKEDMQREDDESDDEDRDDSDDDEVQEKSPEPLGDHDSEDDTSVSENEKFDSSFPNQTDENNEEAGFDMEKLRAYEAGKLKYYFAVAEFATPEFADFAYREVDGMEFEHSSAAIDMRSIPADSVSDVIRNRQLRDEATCIPSNYVPPQFVVSALQQTNVQCTWDIGDRDRELVLTKYTSGRAWEEVAEKDDIRAYLASDVSSDEESEAENGKATQLRKMLGLDSDANDSDVNEMCEIDDRSSESESDNNKEVAFIPGEEVMEKKAEILEKEKELTPWEKFQEKRKQKRREKRAAARAKRKEVNEVRKGIVNSTVNDDEFFVDNDGEEALHRGSNSRMKEKELELLVAGDDSEEGTKDFDMRGLERIEKNKNKKLRGSRKRNEEKLASTVAGTDFKVDVTDERFKAVLEGDDRFGIDRTDPRFMETSGMRQILAEQTQRRKKKRKTREMDEKPVVDDQSAEDATMTQGAKALSALVSSIKAKVKS